MLFCFFFDLWLVYGLFRLFALLLCVIGLLCSVIVGLEYYFKPRDGLLLNIPRHYSCCSYLLFVSSVFEAVSYHMRFVTSCNYQVPWKICVP